jgi:hypothetical protein
MLQSSQMVALPVSGLLMGMMISLAYVQLLGWPLALAAGGVLGLLLCLTAAWVAYRSDCSARHTVANCLLYLLGAAPLVGGAFLVLAQMAQRDDYSVVMAWAAGVVTVLAPVLGPAWQTHARLVAEGDAGPWARKHLDLRAGVLLPGALGAAESPRPAMTPWQIGALAVNLPLLWRLQGGGDAGLLALALMLMVVAMVWAGVAQVGPALGAAWFVLDIERRTGQRLRHPQWVEVQAMRRDHWLARWFMREV